MKAMDRLSAHLKTRTAELRRLKEGGIKIVGYSPGGYMPEELVYASGAIPVCLVRGGDPEPVTESLAYIPRFIDTFCRSQIGYRTMGTEPLYLLPDLIVVPITDNNHKAIADCWNFWTDDDVFRYGVPHNKSEEAFEYYLGGLNLLKERLEQLTGNKITDQGLKKEIASCNRMRSLLKDISFMRRSGSPCISSRDYVRLHHASFIADKSVFLEILDALYEELRNKGPMEVKGPRILLTGSTLAMGDSKVLEMVETCGGQIVFEEFAEGIRPYVHNVELNGDEPMKALAKTYLIERLEPAWFRPSKGRIEVLMKFAEAFKVDGVIWYQLMYRDAYDMQSYYFEKILKEEAGLPMLKLESDYDTSEKGPMKTRIETFIKMLQQG
ncbi:MAG: 2-hydroxyacyl-CoA dehydratase [Deltaproteobacteria bacterium]|nr:2-hydroxyacyl-CoA dehydratase [Deltaproteobacteria bacterium]